MIARTITGRIGRILVVDSTSDITMSVDEYVGVTVDIPIGPPQFIERYAEPLLLGTPTVERRQRGNGRDWEQRQRKRRK